LIRPGNAVHAQERGASGAPAGCCRLLAQQLIWGGVVCDIAAVQTGELPTGRITFEKRVGAVQTKPEFR